MDNEKFRKLLKKINFYPPYIGAGIKVTEFNEALSRFVVEMDLKWYNKNAVGTHFGGSLYAMCDPFYMFILMANLGSDYIVWDKTANIDFKKPGKGLVKAIFEIDNKQIAEIKKEIAIVEKKVYQFNCEITDQSNEVVATIVKGVYVRKKK